MNAYEKILLMREAPITNIPAIDKLDFREKTIEKGDQNRKVLVATPTESFWELRSKHKDELLRAGITVSGFRGRWSVCWWKRDHGYDVPELSGFVNEIKDEN